MTKDEEDLFEELIKKNNRATKYKLARRARSSAETENPTSPVEAVGNSSNGGSSTAEAIRQTIRNYWGINEEDEEEALKKLQRR